MDFFVSLELTFLFIEDTSMLPFLSPYFWCLQFESKLCQIILFLTLLVVWVWFIFLERIKQKYRELPADEGSFIAAQRGLY